MNLVVRSSPVMENNFVATDITAVAGSISWCFRPLFIWMRILGIDLHPSPSQSKSIRRYGLVMLLLGTWAHIENNLDTFRKLLANTFSSSATSNWNIGIDYVNNFCFIVLVSLQIFYVARKQCWQLLWGHIVEFDSDYCQFNYNVLRKLLLIGFLSPLLVGILHNYISLIHIYTYIVI